MNLEHKLAFYAGVFRREPVSYLKSRSKEIMRFTKTQLEAAIRKAKSRRVIMSSIYAGAFFTFGLFSGIVVTLVLVGTRVVNIDLSRVEQLTQQVALPQSSVAGTTDQTNDAPTSN